MADGKAYKNSGMFRLEYGVAIDIDAPPEKIWPLLTNAAELPKWNSTVTSIDGKIALNDKITVKVPIAPDRAFTLTVAELEPNKRMVWKDSMGQRTFTLERKGQATTFTMVEVLSGMMLPMIKGFLPDFGPVFEQYAKDLKTAAEK